MASTTTGTQVVTRARHRSDYTNAALVSDTTTLVHVLNRIEHSLHTELLRANRTFYQTTGTVTSTSGSSGRTADLSGLSPAVYRVLLVQKADGTEVALVDVQDTGAELAPRYTQRGLTLVEVGNDWNTASVAAVPLTITYVRAAPRITALGDTLFVDDQFADLYDNRLAAYLAQKDVGRDPAEVAALDAEYATRLADYIEYTTQVSGTERRRFDLPMPEVKD